eukprot:NODE_301_length_11418_cov_0.342521.p9 type:complete len:102 gc:universal NODE_301_length_11418_cov_0.342521:6394-6089(-)
MIPSFILADLFIFVTTVLISSSIKLSYSLSFGNPDGFPFFPMFNNIRPFLSSFMLKSGNQPLTTSSNLFKSTAQKLTTESAPISLSLCMTYKVLAFPCKLK